MTACVKLKERIHTMKEVTLIQIHDCLAEMLDQAYRDNTGKDGHPINKKTKKILDACVDYLNSLVP